MSTVQSNSKKVIYLHGQSFVGANYRVRSNIALQWFWRACQEVSHLDSLHQLCLERWGLEAHKLGIYEFHLGPLDRSHRAYAPYVSDEDDEMQALSKFGALACPHYIQFLQQKF